MIANTVNPQFEVAWLLLVVVVVVVVVAVSQVLLNTIVTAMPAVVNIFGLLAFFLLIFATVGVQVFALIEHGDALNEYVHVKLSCTCIGWSVW